jgi:hypothetical protein
MFPTVTNRAVLLMTLVVAIVGSVDAAFGGMGDLVAVFALIASLQVVLLLRLSGRRPAVPVRADLVRWIRDRALAEGDSPSLIVDRAISAYRADLLGDHPDVTGAGAERSQDRAIS